MIWRVWRGRAKTESASAYERHLETLVFPRLLQCKGFRRAHVLRRHLAHAVEFLVATEWASWDAVREFAGAHPDRAVIDPAARALLIDAEETVEHFEVARQLPAR
jgi:heme-degrading monooxygenase HmoA